MLENGIYLTLLRDSGLFSGRDLNRVSNGLSYSRTKFAMAWLAIADAIRDSFQTGRFVHPCPEVIRFRPDTSLPIVAKYAFRQIYLPDGTLRDDFDGSIASRLIALFSGLKKMRPAKAQAAKLSAAVIDSFKANQSDTRRKSPEAIRYLMGRPTVLNTARSYFHQFLDSFLLGCDYMAFGPGVNMDAIPASESPRFNMPCFSRSGLPREFRDLYRSAYCATFRRRFGLKIHNPGDIEIKATRKREMVFHAVPKSIKSYRGVGKTNIFVMSVQLILQRGFYHRLPIWLPLNNQDEMANHLRKYFHLLGTIDLKDASDTCSWETIEFLGRGHPAMPLLKASRIKKAIIRETGEVVVLAAPMMGEGITFPVMSAYLCSLALAATPFHLRHLVRCYGDDVQTPAFEDTIELFTHVGLRCNTAKSYGPRSLFKESCEAHLLRGPDGTLFDARPRYVPAIHGSLFSPSNQYRVIEFVKSLPQPSGAFRRFVSTRIPTGACLDQLCYPSFDGTTDDFEATYVPRVESEFVLSDAGALRRSLRRPIDDSLTRRRQVLDNLTRVPHKLVTRRLQTTRDWIKQPMKDKHATRAARQLMCDYRDIQADLSMVLSLGRKAQSLIN